MKRVDRIKTIEGFGCVLTLHGAKHDWYQNPQTSVSQPVPRHREIKDRLARHIFACSVDSSGEENRNCPWIN